MKCGLLILGAVITFLNLPVTLACGTKRVVCYYGSWSVYRPGNGRFTVEDIDPNLCTHGIYAFVGLGDNGTVRILDSWNEINLGGFRRFRELKNRNPNFKALVAIGGWNEGSERYSQMANNPTTRRFFVSNAVAFVRQHGFDGFDLDWEFPGQRGGAPSDRAAFSQLIRELRTEFDRYGLLLTAAVQAAEAYATISYNVPDLNQYLDFISVMTYDLEGSWNPVTGHNAPLYPGPVSNGHTVHESIQFWIRAGASRQKINMGFGTYGRTFTMRNSNPCALRVAATGAGLPGPYTREAGYLGYNEICEEMSSWAVHWDNQQQVSFGCKGNQFAGFDNIPSTTTKAQYAVQQGLGGIMIWSVETDDFLGRCHGRKYPLIAELNGVLCGGVTPNTTTTTTTTSTTTTTTTTTRPTTTTTTTTTTRPTTTSTTTTTPQPGGCPTTDPNKLCTREGYVKDPCNPRLFYWCIIYNGVFTAHRYECGVGTVFDPSINGCNWPYNVPN